MLVSPPDLKEAFHNGLFIENREMDMRKRSLALLLTAALVTSMSVTGCQKARRQRQRGCYGISRSDAGAGRIRKRKRKSGGRGWKPTTKMARLRGDDRDGAAKTVWYRPVSMGASKLARILWGRRQWHGYGHVVGFALGVCEPQSSGIGRRRIYADPFRGYG